MTARRLAAIRLHKELEELLESEMKNFRNIQVPYSIFKWEGLIVPDNPPYDKGAFTIEIIFPDEYPIKPPKITFKTPIYHPNIDEEGQVPVILAENWNPVIGTKQVIQSLIALMNDPQPEHALRADLAEEYSKDRQTFFKNAEEFTKKHGQKRPPSPPKNSPQIRHGSSSKTCSSSLLGLPRPFLPPPNHSGPSSKAHFEFYLLTHFLCFLILIFITFTYSILQFGRKVYKKLFEPPAPT